MDKGETCNCPRSTRRIGRPYVVVLVVLGILFVAGGHNVVGAASRLPNYFNRYVRRDKSLNAQAMEDALASVGIPEQVSSSFVADSNGNNKDGALPRFAKAKGVKFNKFGLEGGGSCFGLVPKSCVPCTPEQRNYAGTDKCDSLESACNNLFCEPLCLKTLMDCKVKKIGGKFSEISQPATSDALCRILEAQTCVVGGCCNSDDKLHNYVENAQMGAQFRPATMIEACNHNAKASDAGALCGECKAALAGKIDAKVYKMNVVCNPLEAYVAEHGQDPDCTSGERWCPRNYNFGFPGVHPHKSLKEMCEELHPKLAGALPGMAAAFSAGAACSCLGCCDPLESCPFPNMVTV